MASRETHGLPVPQHVRQLNVYLSHKRRELVHLRMSNSHLEQCFSKLCFARGAVVCGFTAVCFPAKVTNESMINRRKIPPPVLFQNDAKLLILFFENLILKNV